MTPEEEQALADKIKPLIQEQIALEEKRRSGITLEKNQYIGDRTRELEEEIKSLKKPEKASSKILTTKSTTMTPEELFKPRYKVIAVYPDSPFTEGQIIELTSKADKEFSHTEEYFILIPGERCNTAYGETYFNCFPHLFKKLEWWEERKPEDLPKFIKSKNDGNVQELIAVTECGFKVKWGNKKKYRIGVFNRFIPATEAEYTQYVKTLNQQQ